MHLNSSRPFVDGWRGRIGLVATAPGNATEAEFNRYRPEGVAVMTTRTPLTSSTPKGIRAMNRGVEEAAAMLAENAYCDVILLSSTAGSFVEGLQADLAQARPGDSARSCMRQCSLRPTVWWRPPAPWVWGVCCWSPPPRRS